MPRRTLLTRGLAAALLLTVQIGPARGQAPPGHEETPAVRFEHLGRADGLAANVTRALLQDRTGFLWIATGNGLLRYDGYTFHNLAPGNSVWALAEDRGGRHGRVLDRDALGRTALLRQGPG